MSCFLKLSIQLSLLLECKDLVDKRKHEELSMCEHLNFYESGYCCSCENLRCRRKKEQVYHGQGPAAAECQPGTAAPA